uniref:Serine/threonine-protein phosphatase CPPED1 n=1 Tax=Timema cristinae TaxID=61476 RepID=A0A7R9CDP9_TIMCR|nr:unnamed protein product [Timema cristinae]
MNWKTHTKKKKFTFFDNEREKVFQEPFYFIQGADIQLGLIQRYIEKNPVPGWSKELQLAELAVKKVNAMRPKPKFFVMCGDLCDAMPYDMPLIRQKQEIDFKQVFYKLDPVIPLVCVCGNHDVGDQPTEDSIEAYHKSFGEDYFSFWCGGVMFIVINSQYFYDSSQVKKQAEDHELWLSNTLQTARKYYVKRVIVFQHIPWFLHDPKENNLESYFTLPQDVRNKWLPILKQSGVQFVFCGHYHRNAIGSYEGMDVVTTSAVGAQLGNDRSGLRVVRVMEDSIDHTYYNLENIPSVINL